MKLSPPPPASLDCFLRRADVAIAAVFEQAPVRAQGVNPDSDCNGLPDAWENQYLGLIGNDASADPGGVGRTLLQSYQQGLSPWPTATVASGLRVVVSRGPGGDEGREQQGEFVGGSVRPIHSTQSLAVFHDADDLLH